MNIEINKSFVYNIKTLGGKEIFKMEDQNENMGACNLKVLIKQAKNASVSALEKIINMGVENDEIIKAILEVAKYDVENIIMSLIYLVGKGNKNAIKAICSLSSSNSKIVINALEILSESIPECKMVLEKQIDKNIENLFSDTDSNTIKILENAVKLTHNEKAIDALIKKLFSSDSYVDRQYIVKSLGNIAIETHNEKAINALVKNLSLEEGANRENIIILLNFLDNKKVLDAITNFNFSDSYFAAEKLTNYIHDSIVKENGINAVIKNVLNSLAKMIINTADFYSKNIIKTLAASDVKDIIIDYYVSNGKIKDIWLYFDKPTKNGDERIIKLYIESLFEKNETTILNLIKITNSYDSIQENAAEIKTILKLLQARVNNGDEISLDYLRIIGAKIEDNKEYDDYVIYDELKLINVISEIINEDNKNSSIIVFIINQLYDMFLDDYRYDSNKILDLLLSIKDYDNLEIKNELINTFESILDDIEGQPEYEEKISSRIKELKSEKKLAQRKTNQ